MKPVIGIVPLVDIERESYWMLPGYMEGLLEAGALPVMLPLTDRDEDIADMVARCDGFLFSGGHDVSPQVYGETPIEACGQVCAARDQMEARLFAEALRAEKPMLGICRGIQFINAVLGGTLYQDLKTQRPEGINHVQKPPYDVPLHSVSVDMDSPLGRLLGAAQIRVNSYHHQAIKDLSPRLTSMAVSEDGLVEAVYMPDQKFVWAVQWHPEFAHKADENCRKILRAFVESTK